MHSFSSLEIPHDLADTHAIRPIEPLPSTVQQIETQPLGTTQVEFADLVQTGQILDLAPLQERSPPEGSARAVDQVDVAQWRSVHQDIAPFEIIVGKAMLMHYPGGISYLMQDMPRPARVMQARGMLSRQACHIPRSLQLFGDQCSALETTEAL